MIASMMMYQRPQLVDAHNAYWALIRRNFAKVGIESPETLSQDAEEFSVWLDPELVLSQTCGMPFRTRLHGKVTLIGTPDFGVSQCLPGYYRSALIVRADDPRQNLSQFKDAIFAYNQKHSQSGYAAPFQHLKSSGFWFENKLQMFQHLESARAVANGRADIASLDAVSWRLIRKYESFASELRVLEWTMPTPGLPYITALGTDAPLVFEAIAQAIDHLSVETRNLLGIKGIVSIPASHYLAIPNPEE